MNNEEPTVTFMLKQDANGRQVYTLHTESNTHFPYDSDETHEIIESADPAMARLLAKRIKLERDPSHEEEDEEEGDGGIMVEGECLLDYEDQIVEDEMVVIQEEDVLSEELVYEQVDEEEEVGDLERREVLPGPVSSKKRKMGNDGLFANTGSMGGIITQHMDIREPLNMLRQLLEERLGVKLTEYQFWLQDTQVLEGYKNLVDQCVQGEGLVQVNVQIKTSGSLKKINIVDVLKPAEDYGEPLAGSLQVELDEPDHVEQRHVVTPVDPKQNVVRWLVDNDFKKMQEKLKIPTDPVEWSIQHVKHWLQWAVRAFNLVGLRLSDWHITGQQLCDLTLEQFQAKVPQDPGDLFWTHLELLRKCKFVAVVHKQTETIKYIAQSPTEAFIRGRGIRSARSKMVGRHNRGVNSASTSPIDRSTVVMGAGVGNRTGNNGQIQLWQFLLELLTNRQHTDVICWISSDGEFKLKNPEQVAQLWGERKNKPTMNYEKLSRALRYYYDGDMISKVHGKRFVYKYVCDMKSLIGYDTSELSLLVSEPQGREQQVHEQCYEDDDDDDC